MDISKIKIVAIGRMPFVACVLKKTLRENWRLLAAFAFAVILGRSCIGSLIGEGAGVNAAFLLTAICPGVYCVSRHFNRPEWLAPWAQIAIPWVVFSAIDFWIYGQWRLFWATATWLFAILGLLFLAAKPHQKTSRWPAFFAWAIAVWLLMIVGFMLPISVGVSR